jgi:hypothetical protein
MFTSRTAISQIIPLQNLPKMLYQSIVSILCGITVVYALDAPLQDSKCYRDTPIPRARLQECISGNFTSSANCRPDRSYTTRIPTVMTICALDDVVVRMWNYDLETPNRQLWCDAVVQKLNATIYSEEHCNECGCCDGSKVCFGFSKSPL